MKHKKRDMLLTDHQRDVLKGIEKVTDTAGRQNDKICRDKLEMYLNSASDALLILDMLPQLTAYIKEEDRKKFYDIQHLHQLLLVVEKLISLIDPAPIKPKRFDKTRTLEAVREFFLVPEEPLYVDKQPVSQIFLSLHHDAAPEEIATHEALQDLAEQLDHILHPQRVRSSLSVAELIAEAETRYPGFKLRIDSMTGWIPSEGEEEITPDPEG